MRGVAGNSVDFGDRLDPREKISAILRNVDFRGPKTTCPNGRVVTDLTKSFFNGCDMIGTLFDSSTDLSGSSLWGANLAGSIGLNQAVLTRTEFDASTTFPDGKDWVNTIFFTTNLKNMNIVLNDQDISYTDWSQTTDRRYADFSYGSFLRTNATGATFHSTNFTLAYLQAIIALNSDFTGSNLADVTSQFSTYHGASLANTNIGGAQFQKTEFDGCDMTGATFDDLTNFQEAWFDGETVFPDGLPWVTTDFFSADLRLMRLRLDGEDITGVNYSPSVDSRFANLTHSSMVRTIDYSYGRNIPECQLDEGLPSSHCR